MKQFDKFVNVWQFNKTDKISKKHIHTICFVVGTKALQATSAIMVLNIVDLNEMGK